MEIIASTTVQGSIFKDYAPEMILDPAVCIKVNASYNDFAILRKRAIEKGIFNGDYDCTSFSTTKGQRFFFIKK